MGEWVCFALGFAEFCIGLCALAVAFWVVTIGLSYIWDIHTDKVQFYTWLANKDDKADNAN